MPDWYVDEGLDRLIDEWKAEHPGAVVYTIADRAHSTDPDVSQHAPDDGGKQAGDDKGEVDAGDFMPGKGGVTDRHLDDLAEGLRLSHDKRILIVIRRQRMFSSYPMGGVAPFIWRPYNGDYHSHTHVSVNDLFDNNQSDWSWEKMAVRPITYKEVDGKLPETLMLGQEDDNQDGWNPIMRVQALANLLDRTLPNLDPDGVYGAVSARKFGKIFKTNGRTLTFANIKQLHGIS